MDAKVFTAQIRPAKPAKAFVGDDGIYVPARHDARYHEMIISKELFVEAYNKWIKGTKTKEYGFYGEDDADCWCD